VAVFVTLRGSVLEGQHVYLDQSVGGDPALDDSSRQLAMTRASAQRGFTLIEIVVTVAIVALLATAVLPLAELGVRRGKEQDLRIALRQIRTAIDEYKLAADQGRIELEVGQTGYPSTLNLLVDGVVDIRNPEETMMYFMRRVPRDPFYPDPSVDAADTWGLRSYDSPPDQPAAGEDVFDVYSLALGTGLNGVAYRDW
jgi:general secretion pathway protein G